MKFTTKDRLDIFEDAISWIVVFAMLVYGAGKWVQFEGATAVNKVVSEMTGQELMWAFYGYSRAFVLTLGFLEILGGILILIKRTRIIGCLLISTILVNIILQDIYYGVNYGALKAAIWYQSLILIVLWLNRAKLIQSFKILTDRVNAKSSRKKFFIKIFVAFLLFAALRVLEYFFTAGG